MHQQIPDHINATNTICVNKAHEIKMNSEIDKN